MSRELTHEEQRKLKALDEISDRFIDELKAAGAQGYVIGNYTPVAPDITCLTRFAGDSAILINLIGSLAAQLMPEDFQDLLRELARNPAFAHLREVPRAQKSTMVN